MQSGSHTESPGVSSNSRTWRQMPLRPPVSVFEFENPKEYLCAVLEEKKFHHPSFSLRAWSKQLGFKNPSYLSAVLRGTRRLKPSFGKVLCSNLGLENDAAKRFELLILKSNAKTTSESQVYEESLRTLGGGKNPLPLKLEQFRLIADWHHLVLLEMLELSDFDSTYEFMSSRLGGQVMPAVVELAVQRLIRLGLIQVGPKGKLKRCPEEPHFGDDIPSAAIREHHLQMLRKAWRALQEHPAETRDFRGSTFVLSKENTERAKSLIRKFHKEMRSLEGSGEGDEVYRFNSELFRLTSRVSK